MCCHVFYVMYPFNFYFILFFCSFVGANCCTGSSWCTRNNNVVAKVLVVDIPQFGTLCSSWKKKCSPSLCEKMDNRTKLPSTPANDSCPGKKLSVRPAVRAVWKEIRGNAKCKIPACGTGWNTTTSAGGHGGTVRHKFLHYLWGPVDCCCSVAHISLFKCTTKGKIWSKCLEFFNASWRCTPDHHQSPWIAPDHFGPPSTTMCQPRSP